VGFGFLRRFSTFNRVMGAPSSEIAERRGLKFWALSPMLILGRSLPSRLGEARKVALQFLDAARPVPEISCRAGGRALLWCDGEQKGPLFQLLNPVKVVGDCACGETV